MKFENKSNQAENISEIGRGGREGEMEVNKFGKNPGETRQMSMEHRLEDSNGKGTHPPTLVTGLRDHLMCH